MIEERHIELMNQEIDGVNSPEESRELQRLLDTSPEAKRYYEELLRLGDAFGEIEDLDPPSGMRGAILSAVDAKKRPGQVESDSVSWFEALRSVLSPRVAYGFAAGLVLGIGLYAVLSNVTPAGDRDALVGAMVEADSGVTVDPVVIDHPEVSGSLLVRYSDDLILALLELSGEAEIRVVIECVGDTGACYEGYRLLEGEDHAVRVAEDRVELLHTGHHKVLITFRDPSRSHPAVHIQAFSAGKLLFEEDVRVE